MVYPLLCQGHLSICLNTDLLVSHPCLYRPSALQQISPHQMTTTLTSVLFSLLEISFIPTLQAFALHLSERSTLQGEIGQKARSKLDGLLEWHLLKNRR